MVPQHLMNLHVEPRRPVRLPARWGPVDGDDEALLVELGTRGAFLKASIPGDIEAMIGCRVWVCARLEERELTVFGTVRWAGDNLQHGPGLEVRFDEALESE